MMRVYNKVSSMTKVSFPLLGSILAELNWPPRPASTHWADLNAPGKWPSAECRNPVRICGGLAIPSAVLYSVMGEKQVESVYCDFTKLPTDSGKNYVIDGSLKI